MPLCRRAGAVALRSRPFFFLISLAVLLSACATVAPPILPRLPAPQWESAKLIEALSQRRAQFSSLRALARISYAGPEGKHGFDEAVLVQRPDRLRLETLTMLGAILIVTANDKEIIGYHPREGVLVRGQSSKANLLRYTQIPLELDEITALLANAKRSGVPLYLYYAPGAASAHVLPQILTEATMMAALEAGG